MKTCLRKYSGWLLVLSALVVLLIPDLAEARSRGGGRSFGGSRGGGSFSRPRSSPPSTMRRSPTTSPSPRTQTQPKRSFGGTRLSSPQQYTSRYGTPRRTTQMAGTNAQGLPQNYTVHQYGGMGDRFMSGYLLGSIPWMWSMPFHPAFYYSRPYYAQNTDGTTAVYPPTFSWTKFLLTMLVIGGIIYIIYRVLKGRKQLAERQTQSSFEV